MGRRGLAASLFGIILVAALALGATLIAGRAPLLGLDLRGGVSVVLQPQGRVSNKILQQAVDIIDRRVNNLGVANSSVQRQGENVVIELPGIRNSQQALATIGATAQLYFRPVYCVIPAYKPAPGHKTGTTAAVSKASCNSSKAASLPTTGADHDN
ncbi:MAG TPA: hypothetical protein VKV25_01745, partial [Acidimicrobiales bacterium]|nr:hypothetical protein [Acidimicrobiales bacterium]